MRLSPVTHSLSCDQLAEEVCTLQFITAICTHQYFSVPRGSKNLIDQNQLKKFMQVGVDVTCMHTNFGGRGLFGFGDISTFKNGQISLLTHGL